MITGVPKDSQFLPKGNSKELEMVPHFSAAGSQTHLKDLSCRQWRPNSAVQSDRWNLTTVASMSYGILHPASVSSYFIFYSIMIRRMKAWPGPEGKWSQSREGNDLHKMSQAWGCMESRSDRGRHRRERGMLPSSGSPESTKHDKGLPAGHFFGKWL